MADNDESSPEQLLQRNLVHHYSDDSDGDEPVKLDIGLDNSKGSRRNNVSNENLDGAGAASTSKELPRREENTSLSFKHFLRYDINSYQNLGARPKVYCDGRPITSISDLDLHQITTGKQTRIAPEFSSALPDFVQDHLVVEQSYLGKDLTNSYSLDLPNLPDFTPNRTSSNINRLNVDGHRDDIRTETFSNASFLDLPVRPSSGFPLDLPIGDPQPTTSRSCPPTSEADVLKTLPDFLTDGPVRTQNNDLISQNQNPERDGDRLRIELETVRRELMQQTHRADRLERQLEDVRQTDQEHNNLLTKNLAQTEENLERANNRVMYAEETIWKLRKEMKALKAELETLKKDNTELRGEASGGPSTSDNINNEIHSQRLAKELRSAADSAEFSLRQLLKGVENLRILASTVENTHRIEEPPVSYLDFDDTEDAL